MSKDSDAIFGCVGALVAVPAVIGGSWLVEGLVAKQLWAWFIVPTFGLSALTVAQAIGIGLLWGLFTPSPDTDDDSKTTEQKWTSIFVKLFLKPLMALFAGWIVNHWM